MISAGDLHLNRHLGVEIVNHVVARLEQLEQQAAAKASLVDVGQQRVHLRLVRQLPKQCTELPVDVGKLLLVRFQVDRLGLFRDPLVAQFELGPLAGLEGLAQRLPVEPPGSRNGCREDGDHRGEPWQQRPHARIIGVEALEILGDPVQVDRIDAIAQRGLGHYLAASSPFSGFGRSNETLI